MEKINLTCETCKTVHVVSKTKEIPATATEMHCNWCPKCEDSATEDYNEWFTEAVEKPFIDPAQLSIF